MSASRPPRSSPVAALGALIALLATATLARTRPPAGAEGADVPLAGPVADGPIDLNAASAAQLERLPRIGPALARRIVEDRAARGPYRTVADLDRVPGIGPGVLAHVAPLVTVSAETTLPAVSAPR